MGGNIINPTIHPKRVRYIKLGEKGDWENECLKDGIIRFGFDSCTDERFPLCHEGNWAALKASFLASGKDKGTATRFTNETRCFFEDDGSTLWITFMFEKLHWGFLTPMPAEKHGSGEGVYRKVAGGWRSADIKDNLLTKNTLSGVVTKLAAYRGTSCDTLDATDYVIRRINGQQSVQAEKASAVLGDLKSAVVDMIQLLNDHDFETLVDLIFIRSGWRRIGQVGGLQKTIDIPLILPTTGEKAFVQVKSRTNQAEFDEYANLFQSLDYQRMFYAYHKGSVSTDDTEITLLDGSKLAEMSVEAGLVSWLIEKVA